MSRLECCSGCEAASPDGCIAHEWAIDCPKAKPLIKDSEIPLCPVCGTPLVSTGPYSAGLGCTECDYIEE